MQSVTPKEMLENTSDSVWARISDSKVPAVCTHLAASRRFWLESDPAKDDPLVGEKA